MVCVPVALCFAELSSRLPSTGGVYTFAYVAMGELWAFVVGTDRVSLEL